VLGEGGLVGQGADESRRGRVGEPGKRGDGETKRFGGAGVEVVLVAWEGGPVGGSADESMKGRDDEVVTWGSGETAMRSDEGAEAFTGAETHVPTSLLQREKDRKRGWGPGEQEGFGGAGDEVTLVTLGRRSRCGWCR
jgi:hypothetical protein